MTYTNCSNCGVPSRLWIGQILSGDLLHIHHDGRYTYIHIYTYNIYIYNFSIGKRDFSASYINLLGDIYQVLVRHQVVDVLVNQASGKISKFDRLCKQNAPTVPSTCSHAVGYFHFCAFCWPGRQAFGKSYFLNGIYQCQVFTFHSDLRGWNILWCCMWGKIITNKVCVFKLCLIAVYLNRKSMYSLRWKPHHNLQAFFEEWPWEADLRHLSPCSWALRWGSEIWNPVGETQRLGVMNSVYHNGFYDSHLFAIFFMMKEWLIIGNHHVFVFFCYGFSRGFVINDLNNGQSVGEHNVLTEFFLGEASIWTWIWLPPIILGNLSVRSEFTSPGDESYFLLEASRGQNPENHRIGKTWKKTRFTNI